MGACAGVRTCKCHVIQGREVITLPHFSPLNIEHQWTGEVGLDMVFRL